MELRSPRMLVDDDLEPAPKNAAPTRPATYAVNALYTAFSDSRGVFSRKLSGHDAYGYSRLFRYEEDRPWFEPVLAFSPARLNLLAIATGLQILIFDVASRRVRYALKGNGRVVTSIAFSGKASSVLATGHSDGSICVWSLEHPSRPRQHLRAFHGACSHVAFNPQDSDLLAGCHQDCISIWCLPSTRPVLVTRSKDSGIRSLYWFSRQPERVIGMSSSGSVSIYEVHQALKVFRATPVAPQDDDLGDDEHPIFGGLDGVGHMPSSTFDLGFRIAQALLVGRNGLIVLPRLGHVLFFITFMADNDGPTELWRLRLDAHVDCFSLRMSGNAVEVLACLGTDTQVYEVPAPVLDGMGWAPGMAIGTSQNGHGRPEDKVSSGVGLMRPELSFYQRIATAPSKTTSMQISKVLTPTPKREPTKRPQFRSTRLERDRSQTPTPQSMTSSLELPKPDHTDDERGSPMPFLSPTIPARRGSPTPVAPLAEDMLSLPPRASYDSITSAADHDSDSDDENFADNMQGSGSFLPGGVNVPLPRTCGAAFAPNGHLLTFFPSKGRPMSAVQDAGIAAPFVAHDSEANSLFPTFGLLPSLRPSKSGTDDAEKWLANDERAHRPSPFAVRRPSNGHASWPAKVSPVKTNFHRPVGQYGVHITIRELRSLEPTKRNLAEQYSLLSEDEESVAELCTINANTASDAGLADVAELWQLLALILEERTVTGSLVSDNQRYPPGVGQRPSLSRIPSMASGHSQLPNRIAMSRLNWMQHPFGRYWAIQAILDWAEMKADIQALSYISALLLRAAGSHKSDSVLHTSRPITPSESFVQQPNGFELTRIERTILPPGIPLLRTGTGLTDVSFVDDSPVKPNGSQGPSRDPSQPTTPYFDSSSSTPPYMLLTMSQQSSRVSASGSASPEMHRASFSQAAKHYAQTITDKLAGYGSSPPYKKMGTSPGANELSSSLPNATPGSWTKSVSFASAISTERNSERSLSLAQEDDNYDSDKTIDDTSLPHTPRRTTTEVFVKVNKEAQFFDEPTMSFPTSYMPEGYNQRTQVWRNSYAEQLRSWDLMIEAAELENITDPEHGNFSDHADLEQYVEPHIPSGQRGAICSVCSCLIQAAAQICPACLHSTHPTCLEHLLAALGEGEFTCPSGCGCECGTVTDISYGVDGEDDDTVDGFGPQPEKDLGARPQFQKRRSLTDPRALRQRLEGDSW